MRAAAAVIVIMNDLEIGDMEILACGPSDNILQRLAVAVTVNHDEIVSKHLTQRRGIIL